MDVRPADVRRERDALHREVEEVRASRKRLAHAAEGERRNIELALHDGVQQHLVGIAAAVDLLEATIDLDAGCTQLIDDLWRDVQQALEEARELAERIYPPLLEAGGLGVALRSAAEDRHVTVRIDVALTEGCPRAIASTIYRCGLDILERVESRTRVAVAVREQDSAIAFEIVADCDAADVETSMRDRVQALGGRLTVEGGSGSATHVIGSVPLDRPG